MILKIDIRKAYNSLEWEFIDKVVSAWGIFISFQSFIQSCTSTLTYSILVNGKVSRPIILGRGLRQGDPMSLHIFILCSKILTRLFFKGEAGHIHKIKICEEAPAILHLLYVDDLLIAYSALEQDTTFMLECFKKYCCYSSQRANLENLIFSSRRECARGISK